MTGTLPNPATLELQRIIKIAHDVVKSLRAQRTLLEMRGVDKQLSPEPIQRLDLLADALAQTMVRLNNESVEISQLRALARTTELINSTLDLDLVLMDVVDTVIALTTAERGYIVLRDPLADTLDFRIARSAARRSLTEAEVQVSRSIIEQVATTQELVVVRDAITDTRFGEFDSVSSMMLRSILCVPLLVKGRLTGMIYVDNRSLPGIFGRREQGLVQAFANQAAIAIENARLFDSVRASIAEITAARNLMDNVFTSVASGIITTDDEDRIETFNLAAERLFGVSREESLGRLVWEVLPPLLDDFHGVFQRVRHERTPRVFEVEAELPQRGAISLTFQIAPLRSTDEANEARGVALVLTDVTEIKRRNAQLRTVKLYMTPEMVDNIRDFDDSVFSAQERMISVLACDIRGFTTFSEGIQPEALMQIVNQYLTVSSDAIALREGVIDKFIGDAVVGLYNTQLNPQEDHVLRAVQAALLMAHDVEMLHQILPPAHHLRYGIGVHTGPATLGNIGSATRREFTAVGETVQYAKFLQENALGGQVLISEAVYALVYNEYAVEQVQPHRALDHYGGEPLYWVTGLLRAG